MQVLTHTPLLRDYFLSDRHLCLATQVLILYQATGEEKPHINLQENQCIVCEIAKLFQEFYSGHKTPFSPHKVSSIAEKYMVEGNKIIFDFYKLSIED